MKFIFLVFTSFMVLFSTAQTIRVGGKILDDDGVPLMGANVVVSTPDSAQYVGSTDADGRFGIEVPSDIAKAKLTVMYFGFENWEKEITGEGKDLVLGEIAMTTKNINLEGIEVEEKMPLAIQKGDTTQYNADAFKSNPDASAEDIIAKMPGITMEDGKVKAQGEDVKQVLIDGKPYFGDDPNMALKNLPADIIDKIQVYDQASDQSQFTGFDDGNTSKTINIITKTGIKDGIFGRVYGGYGYDNKYQGGGNFNYFKEDTRFSLIVQSNNINNQNFSSEDLTGATAGSSSGGGRQGRGGGGGGRPGGGGGNSGDAGNFLVSPRGGINTIGAIGLNYLDKWGKKLEFSGSYFFNYTRNNAFQSLDREYYLESDSIQTYTESGESVGDNFNHRFNFKIDYNIDSNNSITIRPRLSIQHGNTNSMITGGSFLGGNSLNASSSNYNSSNLGLNFNGDMVYKHKFSKAGRTLSIGINSGYNISRSDGTLLALNTFYDTNMVVIDSINQQNDYDNSGYTIGGRIEYTEPIGKSGILMINYNPSFQYSDADKYTRNYDVNSGSYNTLDSLLSNSFVNEYMTQKAGVGYRLRGAKYNLNITANYQFAQLNITNSFPLAGNFVKEFHNILPMVMFNYKFSNTSNLRIMYRTNTQLPSSNQLQNVVNNTNPLLLSSGNADLKQTWNHNLMIRYGKTNTEKASMFFIMARAGIITDYIGSNTFVASNDTLLPNGLTLLKGAQFTRPENVGYQLTSGIFITYGMPVAKLKSNINLNVSADYSRTPSILNDQMNYANVGNFGVGISLTSNISQNIDFTISTKPSYNLVTNTLRNELNNNFFKLTNEASLKWIFWKGMYVETRFSHQFYQGLSANFDPNIVLWNGGMGYKFLKDRSLDLNFMVFDILNENNSITRNTTETYVEDVQTNVLNRYFMLTLSWKFNKFSSGKS